jgi:septation ring formation regulator EzrA
MSWTLRTLKKYFEQKFKSIDRAVTKAEIATEKRFETVNEWRESYADLVRSYIPRNEYESGHETLEDKINIIDKKIEKMSNIKQGGSLVIAYVISAISLLIAIISVFLSLGIK